jgi:heme/copper-type cytochrome/quinol oxidase subunit 2
MSFSFADAIFWIAAVCCAVAQTAILHSAIVSPARAASTAEPTTAARRAGEIAWAVIPGIALALVMVWTWHAMHSVQPMHLMHAASGATTLITAAAP